MPCGDRSKQLLQGQTQGVGPCRLWGIGWGSRHPYYSDL